MENNKKIQEIRTDCRKLINSFKGRILEFDDKAMHCYTALSVHTRKVYGPTVALVTPDMYIAAIAHANNCKIATQNVKDFSHISLEIINPANFSPELNMLEQKEFYAYNSDEKCILLTDLFDDISAD